MFTDNEARRRIEMLERRVSDLDKKVNDLSYIRQFYGYQVSVKVVVAKILEHLGLEVRIRPEETVLVKKEE